jgi:putative membrane protein
MEWARVSGSAAAPSGAAATGRAAYAAILALGAALFWLSQTRPALLPAWSPWDFSPPIYLATAMALFWYCRGVGRASPAERPALWRKLAFLLGIGLIYAVLQTRFEYWSQHMFFLNRIQHVAMHHLGPFLVALAGAGGTIKRGMPATLRRAIEVPSVTGVVDVLQQPLLAAFLFFGLFCFWLIPAVHFLAMIDVRLYAVMNWSMVLDGLLFWSLVLDRRPKPPARISFGARAALAFGVMFPQIALGAAITFSQRDFYPYYDLCGRLFPSISALNDQHIGGIVIWIPPAMMSAIAVLLAINALRLHEDAASEDGDGAALAALSKSWTGR